MSGLYRFDGFEVDVLHRELRRQGQVLPLSAKPFDVLLALIARAGQVVSKEDLLSTVWPNSFVEEANLTQSIFVLRKVLGEKASGARYIVTVPGRGYQLAVLPESGNSPLAAPEVTTISSAPTKAAPRLHASRRMRVLVLSLVAGAAVAVMTIALWRVTHAVPFARVTLRQLTNSGDLRTAAISPSGRYLAWVSRSLPGQESLSISDRTNSSSHVLLRTESDVLENLAFPPDEGFVYYRSVSKNNAVSTAVEHRVPLLGGEPALVANAVDSPITFLDRGKRICFAREQDHGRFSFLSADAEDGSDEHLLASMGPPHPVSALCSPDGQRAIVSGEVGGLTTLSFQSGRLTPFYDAPQAKTIITHLAWTADGKALVTSSATPFAENLSLGYLSYPGASFTPITHDLESYGFPSVTSDRKTIVAVRRDPGLDFRSLDLPLPGLGPDPAELRWSAFLGWWNDNTLVGTTADGGLKLTDVLTGQEHSLPLPHGMQFLQPSGCGQQGFVATGSRQSDQALTVWFVRPDGSGLRQLSHGREDILPVCTPDGAWVVYADNSRLGTAAMYRVPLRGGDPLKVGGNTVWFAVSFHTDQLAWFNDQEHGPAALVINDIETGKQLRSISLPAGVVPMRGLTWAPDDKHIFFVMRGPKADAIWQCGLDGSAPVKVVEVPGHQLATVLTSPGGKRLGFITARPVSDAVLLQASDH